LRVSLLEIARLPERKPCNDRKKLFTESNIFWGSVSTKNADLRFMLYIKNNLWGFAKRYNEI
jgi:hypothetical protein